jgi:hypothetical protein
MSAPKYRPTAQLEGGVGFTTGMTRLDISFPTDARDLLENALEATNAAYALTSDVAGQDANFSDAWAVTAAAVDRVAATIAEEPPETLPVRQLAAARGAWVEDIRTALLQLNAIALLTLRRYDVEHPPKEETDAPLEE